MDVIPSHIIDAITQMKKLSFSDDGKFGHEVSELALKSGWIFADRHSKCSVATYEIFLKKHHWRMHILEGYFFGAFTEINIYDL